MLNPNKSLILIDYEFVGWQPRAMDLAGYVMETVIDNDCKEEPSGIGYSPENLMGKKEIEGLCKKYLKYAKDY